LQRKRPLGRPRNADRDPRGPSSRDRILAAASRLFAERGHDATTMEDVAARSGFTAGALYRHFRGKPDLLLAVIAAALERIPAFQRRAAHPRGRVAQTIGIYVTPQAEEIRRLAREVHATARRDRRVRRLLDAFNRRIRAAAAARVAELRDADPVAAADGDRRSAARHRPRSRPPRYPGALTAAIGPRFEWPSRRRSNGFSGCEAGSGAIG